MKKIKLIIFLLFFCKPAFAQMPELETRFPFTSPMLLNPAMTGIKNDPSFNIFCNTRFRSNYFFDPAVSNMTYEMGLPKINSGIGLRSAFMTYSNGNYKRYFLSAAYAYEFTDSAGFKLRVGAEAGWMQQWADIGYFHPGKKLKTDNLILSAGVTVLYKNYYIGLSQHNITKPESAYLSYFTSVPQRFSIHSGIFIHLTEDTETSWMLNPYFYLLHEGRHLAMIYPGINISKGKWFAGAALGNASAGMNLKRIRFAYNYNYFSGITSLGTNHEIVLSFNFRKPNELNAENIANSFKRIF